MRLLITGGAGFIGSNFVHYLTAKHPDCQVINLDKLTYAGDLANLTGIESPNYTFFQGDIADRELVDELASKTDAIINFAAETHVDNSIRDAAPFIQSNIVGVQVLMEAALKHQHKRFYQISTDEVYGDLREGFFTEASMLKPSNPYSASKAAAEHLVLSYARTYGLPAVISRCSNNYGPRQYAEKLIPFFVKKLMKGERVPVYGDGLNVRDWLHVDDHCAAVDLILRQGRIGEIYNIGANNEHSNLEVVRAMLSILGLPEDRIEFVKDRPGHDIRYAIDASKLRNDLSWEPKIGFDEGFRSTIEWYKQLYSANINVSVDIKNLKKCEKM